jgi:hypothetical protein
MQTRALNALWVPPSNAVRLPCDNLNICSATFQGYRTFLSCQAPLARVREAGTGSCRPLFKACAVWPVFSALRVAFELIFPPFLVAQPVYLAGHGCTFHEMWTKLWTDFGSVRFCSCPLFENLLIDSGIILIKYWVSVSAKEQAKRFEVSGSHPGCHQSSGYMLWRRLFLDKH